MNQTHLTREYLSELFADDFELTYYAIELAQQQLAAGKEDINLSHLLKEIQKTRREMHQQSDEPEE